MIETCILLTVVYLTLVILRRLSDCVSRLSRLLISRRYDQSIKYSLAHDTYSV